MRATAHATASTSRNLLLAALTILATTALAAATDPGRAAASTVSSGPLQAETGSGRWRLSFQDRNGHRVLTEDAGRGTGPAGTLGFRDGTVWRHATRILSERRHGTGVAATLATNDPLGRRIEVVLTPQRPGVIRLRASLSGSSASVTALGIGFDARPAERYLGFGERSNAVDQRGNVVESYVGEGAYPAAERPIIAAFVPPWGYQQRDDATYFPVPWLLSTAGYGVLVDNTETSYYRLASDAQRRLERRGGERTARPASGGGGAAPGGAVAADLRRPRPGRCAAPVHGRHRPPARAAAPWYFGPWFQPSGDEQAQVDALRSADAPVSVTRPTPTTCPAGITSAGAPSSGRAPPGSTRAGWRRPRISIR